MTPLERTLLNALLKIREEIEGPAGSHRGTLKLVHSIADTAINEAYLKQSSLPPPPPVKCAATPVQHKTEETES